jgi:hypothetical protein
MKRRFWMTFVLAVMLFGNLTAARAQTFEYLRAPGALSRGLFRGQLSRDGDFFAARMRTSEAAEAVLWEHHRWLGASVSRVVGQCERRLCGWQRRSRWRGGQRIRLAAGRNIWHLPAAQRRLEHE